MKPQLTGLVDMGSQAAYTRGVAFGPVDLAELGADGSAFSGVVINATWAQLEPGNGTVDWSQLDSSLAAVAAYNRSHPSDELATKLRIFGGRTAPAWAKSLGGGAIADPQLPGTTVGRWWTTPYRAAWSSFQRALAARYDSTSLVRAVAVTSCASLTGEPFIVPMGPSSLSVLDAAGWTPTAQQDCLLGALDDYAVWRHTWIDYPTNPFRTVTARRPVPDATITAQIMTACATSADSAGVHCVLGNHGLGNPAADSSPVYSEINALWQSTPGHVPVYFQTYGPNTGDDCASVALAVQHHATSIELWPPRGAITGFSNIPEQTLAEWNTDLKLGQAPAC